MVTDKVRKEFDTLLLDYIAQFIVQVKNFIDRKQQAEAVEQKLSHDNDR